MGVDVVSVGLRHKLRVNNPLLLFEDVSNRYNANIKVIYNNWRRKNNNPEITLLYLIKEDAIENLTIELPKCQYLRKSTSPKASIIDIDWQSETLIKELWDALCNNNMSYSIEGFKDERVWFLYIYRETVEIAIDRPFRWNGLLENFRSKPENSDWLQDYRKNIYTHAKVLGCDEVIHFGDQYESEQIYIQIDKPVDELLSYIDSRKFYDYYKESDKSIQPKPIKTSGSHQFSRFDIDWAIDSEQQSKLLDIPDFIMNKRDYISYNTIIDVLFDDFRDLKEEKNE